MKMTIEENIKRYAFELGADDAGICSAEDFEEIRPQIEAKRDLLKGFAEMDIEKRLKPSLALKGAKSIIVLSKNYRINNKFNIDGKIRGYISMGAVGEDYHIYMAEILKGVSEMIEKKYGAKCVYFTDTGPLCDRAAAVRSGIGYYGKSGCVITDNAGACAFLGYIITDLELNFDEKSNKSCGKCDLCIRSCPSGAISANGFDMTKCISYITQLKRELTEEEMFLVGKNLYGCDICQKVCAKNKIYVKEIDDINISMPEIKEILSMSNRQFKEKYGKTAMGWRGASVIKRNALCALLQYKNKEAAKIAGIGLKSESALVKNMAEKVLEIMEKAR